MKLISETSDFKTKRELRFKGQEGYESQGGLTVTIEVTGITTEQMTEELEHLMSETFEKAKGIIAAHEAPQQYLQYRGKRRGRQQKTEGDCVV